MNFDILVAYKNGYSVFYAKNSGYLLQISLCPIKYYDTPSFSYVYFRLYTLQTLHMNRTIEDISL